jgi:hypothetical protein
MATLQNDSLARELEEAGAQLWMLAERESGPLTVGSYHGTRWQDEYARRIDLNLFSPLWPHYPETLGPVMRPVLPVGQVDCIKLAADLAKQMSGSWYQYFVEVARDAVGQRIDKERPDSTVIEHWIGCYEFRWLRAAIRRDAPQLLPLIPIMDVTPLGEAEFRQSMRKLEGELRCLLREPFSGDLHPPHRVEETVDSKSARRGRKVQTELTPTETEVVRLVESGSKRVAVALKLKLTPDQVDYIYDKKRIRVLCNRVLDGINLQD